MAASIDVVVPVHDHYALTSGCLEHLARQTVPHRVIVVDDGSTDGTPERLRGDWPAVGVIELGSNRGYTHAVNRGVDEGDGEYVVLLNNDVQLRPDCLARLSAALDADAALGSAASLMLAPGEPGRQRIDSVGVTADVTLAGFARLQGRAASDAASATPVLAGPEGTAGAYRREAWVQVGGLDERIRAYMEILDLALRLRSAGWETTAVPGAAGVHLGSGTYGRRSAAQRRLSGFSRAYLLRRYGVMRGPAAARALLIESLVVAGDTLLCHDLQALLGRLEGWRAAAGCEPRPWPPAVAIDASISLRDSIALRRGALREHGA